ncbi:MAG: FtsW/RodA/SpoVE family cell cycle protein [Deltaproteobacteria bacterium]|nr:FtsW/RodA/SpoVE family cell cycle protein [Deltaproteobacteria bacterium]
MSVGIAVLAIARALGPLRRRSADAPSPLTVPWLLPAMVAASLFGFVIHASTVEISRGVGLPPSADGFAQGFMLGCAGAALLLVLPFDLAQLAARARVPLALAIGGIFAALAVAGSGPAGSGTRINLGPVQPIEIVKPLAVVFLAAYFGARAAKLRWHRQRFLGLRWPRVELLLPALGVLLGIIAGLYVIGDLGPVLLLASVFLGMFYVASRATGWVLLAFALLALVLVIFAIWPDVAGGGTVKTRLVMWQDPWTNGLSNGHQLAEGKWAFNAGGWSGQGLGRAATPLVPAGKTDLVLATMTEQLGARGLVAYHVVLLSIVIGALLVAAKSRTAERVLIASGIAILVLSQWVVILGGSLGHLPLTGIVVPFVSTGRSSTIVFVIAIALVARLAVDGRVRAGSPELDELHAAARGVAVVSLVLGALGIAASLYAALADRTEVAARGIVVRLADGTRVHRMNPRLVALTSQLRRGSILDRDGAPLAVSTKPGTRTYPLGSALGTLIGVSPSRVLLPEWALERKLEHELRGYPERAGGMSLPWPDLRAFVPLLDLDRDARRTAVAALDEDLSRRSVRLTLNAKLQAKVGELARAAVANPARLAVAAVVLDADSGHVLARVQVPDYDPNAPAWQDRVLANDAEFLRKFHGTYGEWPDKTGLQGMFQAGSVGKLFTALAAVRANAASSRLPCRDSDEQGPLFTRPEWGKPIHDHTGDRPHGTPDLASALAVSCNVYFGQLALQLGPAPFEKLRSDGVEIGHGDRFVPGKPDSRHLASTGFGQGAMALSVLQAARMVGAIANGGRYVTCSMRLDERCRETSLVDDPARMHPIVAGMRRVITAGTGARLAAPAGLRVYGKTGTADVQGFAGEAPFGIAPGETAAPHSWFVAFAEPLSTPEPAATVKGRIVVAVVVPRGGTGASAAGPLTMQILSAVREAGYLR